jgi:type VI secretion system protein
MKTLLERLENPPPPNARELPSSLRDIVDSIRNHLQAMLNTRHGTAEVAPDYGTSGFAELFRAQSSIDLVREEILHTIAVYEPRLTDVEIDFVTDEKEPFMVQFNIVASIVTDDEEAPAVFRMTIESSGTVKVSSRGGA